MAKKAKKKPIIIKMIGAKQFAQTVLVPLAKVCKKAGVDLTLGGL